MCPEFEVREKVNLCECSAFCETVWYESLTRFTLENKLCLERFFAKPANLGQVITSEVFRDFMG